jgi:uncharacterized protein
MDLAYTYILEETKNVIVQLIHMSTLTPDQNNDANASAVPHPVEKKDRIKTVDMVRGFALLGILLMNMPGFSIHESKFLSILQGPHDNADYKTMVIIFSFFEGTMRGLFSMLFGAGMVLFTMNKHDQPGRPTVAEYYYRRLLWLVLFGLFNAWILQWTGDILYFYGLAGLLLYAFRNTTPKLLIALSVVCMVIGIYKRTSQHADMREIRLNYVEAKKAEKEKKTLTEEQTEALGSWPNMESNFKMDSARYKEEIAEIRGNYVQVFNQHFNNNSNGEIWGMYNGIWDSLVMMLLGMALLKLGFFSNQWSTKGYALVLLVGYGVGIPIGYLYFKGIEWWIGDIGRYFDMYRSPHENLYDFKRVFLSLGHASLLMLVYRSGLLNWLMRALANVGQMAFTNYLSQSIICSFIFFGYGFGHYDKLRFHQIYYVVFAIWIFQLIFSSIWLNYFRFGPFEWLWRSLTYWKKQPMKIDQREASSGI